MQQLSTAESTNQELISTLKQLKLQLQTSSAANTELTHKLQTTESEVQRSAKGINELREQLKVQTEKNERLEEKVGELEGEGKARKEKHRAEMHAVVEERDRLREQAGVLRARVEEGERNLRDREERVREEAERADKAEEKEEKAREEVELWRRSTEEARGVVAKMEGELAELNVRLEYETLAKTEFKERIDTFANELLDKEKAFEHHKQEIRSLYEKNFSEHEEQIKQLVDENAELNNLYSKSEERVAQLEAVLEQMKSKLEDTTRQLTSSETEAAGLARDRDTLTELRAVLADKERESNTRRDYATVDSHSSHTET